MSRRALRFLVMAAAIFLVSGPTSAHHGLAHYDMKKTIVLTGIVTTFDWGNPHCLLHMDVMEEGGLFRHWTLEMSSTSAMSRRGWAKNTLKPGDMVIVETHPAQNGTALGISASPDFAMKVVINGREIPSR
jgi:Family of unknown function (DUF6152)